MASIPLVGFPAYAKFRPLSKQSSLPSITRLSHSLTPSSKVPSASRQKNQLRPLRIVASRLSSNHSPTPAADRVFSALSYTIPLFNGLHYGHHLLSQFPILAALFEPVWPLFSLYKSIPYGSFIAFFALYIGVARNPSISNYVRFNAMQSVVLDVLLVVPLLLQRILNPGRSGLGFNLMVMGHNAMFVLIVASFAYSFGSCLLGRTPTLPFVADAARRQL